MNDQEVREARERVQALRQQVNAERHDRAVAASASARDARLAALTEEERHLEAQLAEIRGAQRPGEELETAATEPVEKGEILDLGEPPPEGGFVEEVDEQGNLVRRTLPSETATVEPAPAPSSGE